MFRAGECIAAGFCFVRFLFCVAFVGRLRGEQEGKLNYFYAGFSIRKLLMDCSKCSLLP